MLFNIQRLFTTTAPFLLKLDEDLSTSAAYYGYPQLQALKMTSSGPKPLHYYHQSHFRLTTTPDLESLGTESFPQEWSCDPYSAYEAHVVHKYLPELPAVTLSHIANLIGPSTSPMDTLSGEVGPDAIKRTHITTVGLYPIFTDITINRPQNGSSDTILGAVQRDYRFGVSTPDRTEITEAYYQTKSANPTFPPRFNYLVGQKATDIRDMPLAVAVQHPDKVMIQPEMFVDTTESEILNCLAPSLLHLLATTILGQYSPPREPEPKRHRHDDFPLVPRLSRYEKILTRDELTNLWNQFTYYGAEQGLQFLFQ
jgi:hypothetical protein